MTDSAIHHKTTNELLHWENKVEPSYELSAFQKWFVRQGYPRLNEFYREQEGHLAFWSLPSEQKRKSYLEIIWLGFLVLPYLYACNYLELGFWLSLIFIYPSVRAAVVMERGLLFLRRLNFKSMRMLPIIGFSQPDDVGFHFAIRNVMAITDDFIETQYGARYYWEDLMKDDKRLRSFFCLMANFETKGDINKKNMELVDSFKNLLTELSDDFKNTSIGQ